MRERNVPPNAGVRRLHRLGRRPSTPMVISILALVIAASGTAVAATKLVNGDSLIKKNSLSGNRLRNHTITRTQVNLNKLGKVPSAHIADTALVANSATTASSATNAANATNATKATNATNATIATNATTARNANNLGGQPPSSYLTTANRIGTNGVVKEAGAVSPGNNVTLFSVGPFTVTMNCTKSGGTTSNTINASSSEANSIVFGTMMPTANTPTDVGPDTSSTTFSINDNAAVDLEAPSGAGFQLDAADGVNSLGTDCWANWSGIR